VITLEEGELRATEPCEECGAPTFSARGFVYENDDAHAVYLASWSECKPRFIKLAIITGPWGDDDAGIARRKRIGLDADYTTDSPGLRVTDPSESPWDEPSSLSPPMVSRQEALSLPDIDEVFHIADHVVLDDSRIAAFLQTQPDGETD